MDFTSHSLTVLVAGVVGAVLLAGCAPAEQNRSADALAAAEATVEQAAASGSEATKEAVAEATVTTEAVAAEVATATPAAATPAWAEKLFGAELIKADGSTVSPAVLAGKKVGIYFSAHWCPPCRSFTPRLVDTFNALAAAKKPFEIVFISGDRTKEAMLGYMKEAKMPWLAVPYDSELREKAFSAYGVRGIPTLIVLGPDGQIITREARGDVASKGTAAFDGW